METSHTVHNEAIDSYSTPNILTKKKLPPPPLKKIIIFIGTVESNFQFPSNLNQTLFTLGLLHSVEHCKLPATS